MIHKMNVAVINETQFNPNKNTGLCYNILVNNNPIIKNKFPSGELNITFQEDYSKAKSVQVVGNIYNSDDLISLFITVKSLRAINADMTIHALVPYMPYSRSGDARKGEACLGGMVPDMLSLAGVDRIATYDLHQEVETCKFTTYLDNIELHELIVTSPRFNDLIQKEYTHILCPDKGAVERARKVAAVYEQKTTIKPKVVYCSKKRNGSNVKIYVPREKFNGRVKHILFVDDMIDSGSTAREAIHEVHKHHPVSVDALVTHGVLSKGAQPLSIFDRVFLKSLNPSVLSLPNNVTMF